MTIQTTYAELIAKGYNFTYNNRSKKLEASKNNKKIADLGSVADALDFSVDELTNYYLSLKESDPDTLETQVLQPPRRSTNANDITVYGGNLKAIIGDSSISYAIRDPKTNCWIVKSKNSEQIGTLLSLNETFINDLLTETNNKLATKQPVNISDLPRQLFLYNRSLNLGGVIATKPKGSNSIMSIDHFTDKKAFFDNDLVDQYIFTPNSPFANEMLSGQPKVISNDPNEMAISFFDKDEFIKRCKNEYGECVPETPNCDSWLEKFIDSDRELIKDFIWTIFDRSAQTSEALWIYDEGGKGKSTFVKFIEKFVGKYLKSAFNKSMVNPDGKSNTEELNNRFRMASYYDKRVIVFPDCKNKMIAKTEFFHLITGGDWVSVENKNEKSFGFKSDIKVIICSNTYPAIDVQQRNEVRRVLLITVKDPFKELEHVINDFEEKMLEEADVFLYKCYLSYLNRGSRNNGKTDMIQSVENKLASWAETGDIETSNSSLARDGNISYDELFEITNDPKDKLSYTDIEKVLSRTAQGFTDETGTKLKWSYDKRAIKIFMIKDNHLDYRITTVNGVNCRRFIGVKFAFSELQSILDPNISNNKKNESVNPVDDVEF